ncbi:MAG: hypothetical protein D6729_00845 [Deltaproteobacteria bacterium]|nr:MAG: hypothetical protein D6729_00845 [Deltaproteobacteria bacterium]
MNRLVMKLGMTAAASVLLVACGPDLRAFEEVEAQFQHPTATVSESTMPQIFQAELKTVEGSDSTDAAAAFSQEKASAALTALRGLRFATDRQYLTEADCNFNFSFDGRQRIKKITVSCSGSDVSGTIVLEYAYDNDELVAWYIRFENWCEVDGDCVDGWMGFKVDTVPAEDGFEQQWLATAKISSGGESIEWATRYLVDPSTDTERFEWLAYVNGAETVVFTATVRADESGSFSLRGANGWFECSWDAATESGSCADSEGNSFSWNATVGA